MIPLETGFCVNVDSVVHTDLVPGRLTSREEGRVWTRITRPRSSHVVSHDGEVVENSGPCRHVGEDTVGTGDPVHRNVDLKSDVGSSEVSKCLQEQEKVARIVGTVT